MTELGKLSVLDFWVDWSGVNLHDRHAEVCRHVDVSKLPPEMRRQMRDAPGEKGNKLSLDELKAEGQNKQPQHSKSRGKGVER